MPDHAGVYHGEAGRKKKSPYGSSHKKGGIMGDQDAQYGPGGKMKKKKAGYEDEYGSSHGSHDSMPYGKDRYMKNGKAYGGRMGTDQGTDQGTDPVGNKGGLDNMGSAGYKAGKMGGPDRSGRGKYNGDYSGKERGSMYLEGKEKTGAPHTASIKVGGIAQHSISKNQVEQQSTIKARLNRF